MESKIIRDSKNRPVCFRLLRAENAAAVVCIIHGAGGYGGRYAGIAQELAAHRLSCAAVDLPGHGESFGKKGVLPEPEEMPAFFDLFFDAVRREFPGLPLVVFAHSMGGCLGLSYEKARPEADIAVYLISSPWLKLSSLRWPEEELDLLRRLAATSPEMVIDTGLGGASGDDPYVHNMLSIGTIAAILDEGERLRSEPFAAPRPTYIIAGANDDVCDPEGARELARMASGDFHLRVIDGVGHSPLYSERSAEILVCIYAVLRKYIKGL